MYDLSTPFPGVLTESLNHYSHTCGFGTVVHTLSYVKGEKKIVVIFDSCDQYTRYMF